MEYDPAGDGQWTARAPLPAGRAHVGAAVVNGKIYVTGGGQDFSLLSLATLEYDPSGPGGWVARAQPPTRRLRFAAAAANGRLYALGGAAIVNNEVPVTASVEGYAPPAKRS
jgi:hypothetical protein